MRTFNWRLSLALGAAILFPGLPVHTETPAAHTADRPWMNTSLSPDQRADLVLKQLTLDGRSPSSTATAWPTPHSGRCPLLLNPTEAPE